MAHTGLREWLEAVDDLSELKTVTGADWQEEIGAITELYQRNPGTEALLFDGVPDYPDGYRVLSCIMNSPARIALTLGMDSGLSLREITEEFRDQIKEEGFIQPETVTDGPVMENVLEGDDVDVTAFPTPIWHEGDGGRYIGTADIIVTKNPEGDWVNFGAYRSMIHTEDEVGIMSSPGKHGREHMDAYHEQGEACPIALVCGVNPELYFAAGVEVPRGKSEYAYAGWWRDEPVEVIESDVTDLPIPAHAEIVLEGFIEPGNTRMEGPLGEWTGYYAGGEDEEMVVDVERILHRDDPIITGSPPCKPPCEEVYFRCPLRSGNIWNTLEDLGVPGIEGVWCDPAGGSRLWVIVSIDQQYAGHATQVGQLTAQIPQNVYMNRYVVVVDDDIDPTNRADVLWAITTRVHPPQGIDITERTLGSRLDPIPYPDHEQPEEGGQFNARAVIDATRAYETKDEYPPVAEISPELKEQVLEDWPELFEHFSP